MLPPTWLSVTGALAIGFVLSGWLRQNGARRCSRDLAWARPGVPSVTGASGRGFVCSLWLWLTGVRRSRRGFAWVRRAPTDVAVGDWRISTWLCALWLALADRRAPFLARWRTAKSVVRLISGAWAAFLVNGALEAALAAQFGLGSPGLAFHLAGAEGERLPRATRKQVRHREENGLRLTSPNTLRSW